ncbi:MAG: hypothetical protein MZV63_36905 [Marinilabiliales bacterium]|nr:hypothetical protein [Marinilabiliales bacterium]
MGSIVGGMYSIGYSADSLEKLFTTTDWDLVLSNKIPGDKVIYREKRHFLNSIVTLPVSANKVRLPSGLINGQIIESTVNTDGLADIDVFSQLPIPFMCLGTNLCDMYQGGSEEQLPARCHGASIAVPTIFTPIIIDSVTLIDGGFVRNCCERGA